MLSDKIRQNAEKFVQNWKGASEERAESQTFINEFFEIFDLYRKDYGQFEKPIRKKNALGVSFADFLWSGKLIIEAKSANKDNPKNWETTLNQAKEYIEYLPDIQRPEIILLMNFKRFQIHSVIRLSSKKVDIRFKKEVLLENLVAELDYFDFFPLFASQMEEIEEKINMQAAQLIANVYDAIDKNDFSPNEIAIFLARLMFCMFAEDTGIFKLKQFENYLRFQTNTKTLAENLKTLFEVLNTENRENKDFDEVLNQFPYVNGGLFKQKISHLKKVNSTIREALIKCCEYDWSYISPVIFGSLFQAVINQAERRTLGAHYTSEKNILRLLNPLFLEDLQKEFNKAKENENTLEKFRKKISSLTFLDPACGCGNFLVVTYRELRMLDIEIIKLQKNNNFVFDTNLLNNVLLNQFHGYEIDTTSAMIGEVAMWLTQHQLNMRLELEFGETVPTIPLSQEANIQNSNALTTDWKPKNRRQFFDYIMGNPPFVGKQFQTENQKTEISDVFKNESGAGILDYVTCWYKKASEYMLKNTKTQTAFVSTNSISQGEQTGILWNILFNKYNVTINFAHQTFKWSNEAKEFAAVHCVIIGFGINAKTEKYLYQYADIKDEPQKRIVKNISPYLVAGNNITILKRRKPICDVPEICFGSMPNDGGFLILSKKEKDELIQKEPNSEKWIRPLISAHEYLNGKMRWCLWLVDIQPNELKEMTHVYKRVEEVKKHRLQSKRQTTNKLAETPYLFGEIRQPDSDYIVIPLTSSENRKFVPITFINKLSIANNSCSLVPNATIYHFGILTSTMHMAWMRRVCGRLESRYRYSNEIVYNTFPFPKNLTDKQIKKIENAAQKILDIRATYTNSSLSDLYDTNLTPVKLLKAHRELDKIIDSTYRPEPFENETERIEFLFELYEKYVAENS